MMIHAIKGMNDVLPGAKERFLDSAVWEKLLGTFRNVLESYGYRWMIPPVVEDTSLFSRGIGTETDVVSKEMYTFSDRGERSLTLRPEATASVVRAYIEHNLCNTDPVQRFWYFGPMFRAERPQKGRYRQFYQIGGEMFGAAHPSADAELLLLLKQVCDKLHLPNVQIKLNTLGDDASRTQYRQALLTYLVGHEATLCESCQKRLHINPLRVLDCKRENCKAIVQDAPDMLDSLTPEAAGYFAELETLLAQLGVDYSRDKHLVRGLDYYTGVIFEFTSQALGAQDAILGGGRYDKLVQELDGPSVPAIGFAAGVERLALILSQQEIQVAPTDLYLVPMAETYAQALLLADQLRPAIAVEVDVTGNKLKQQMRRADKLQARFALVLGSDEIVNGQARLKDLHAGTEQVVELSPAALISAVKG
jgi:histidyl-tRNA synthetase